jgi:hypothetical protein
MAINQSKQLVEAANAGLVVTRLLAGEHHVAG